MRCMYEKEADSFRRSMISDSPEDTISYTYHKEIVMPWTQKQPHETYANGSHRISLMRLQGSYLTAMGIDACVNPKNSKSHLEGAYIPSIFSYPQLAELFLQAD